MKKQILKISYPMCLTLNVGIYTKALTKRWIEDDQDLDAMYRALTVVIKSLFGVKDAYPNTYLNHLQKVGINEKHVHCCTCSVSAKNKPFQP